MYATSYYINGINAWYALIPLIMRVSYWYLKGYSSQTMHPQKDVFDSLSGVPDYFDRNKISSGGDLSHYSSASLY